MPARRSGLVNAVDMYARGAIDGIAHRINVEFSGHAVFGAEYGHELDAGRFGENIDRPAALDIETSLVGDNTDCAWGGRVGTPDLAETILFEDVDPVHHDSIVWGWSMRRNLWPAGTISGGCAVRYLRLRPSGYEQGSNEGYEKDDSGAHAGIVVAIIPGWGNDSVGIHPANQDCSRLQLNGACVISNCLTLLGSPQRVPEWNGYWGRRHFRPLSTESPTATEVSGFLGFDMLPTLELELDYHQVWWISNATLSL